MLRRPHSECRSHPLETRPFIVMSEVTGDDVDEARRLPGLGYPRIDLG